MYLSNTFHIQMWIRNGDCIIVLGNGLSACMASALDYTFVTLFTACKLLVGRCVRLVGDNLASGFPNWFKLPPQTANTVPSSIPH